jgi:TonB family protein
MSAAPMTQRLRDVAGDSGDLAARAGAIVRAMAAPPPLDAAADARVRAALRGGAAELPGPARRLVAQLGALFFVACCGYAAASALERYRNAQHPEVEPAVVEPVAARAPSAPAPPPPAPPPPEAPKPRPAHAGSSRAQLLIDPLAPPYRVSVPRDLVRAGAGYRALVRVCVSARGHVTRATVLESAHPRLDPLIRAALERWQYAPALERGRPVASCPPPFRYRIYIDP